MENKSTIPVTVLTGFLGSGKTTLLNRILHENHGKKIAVIENEFGEVGVDNELVIGANEEIFEMNNGCICCTVRGDLIRILDQLTKRKDKLDHVIIETTGMANPAPVAQTFWIDEEMKERYSLDAIVTIIDSKHVWQHIDENSECKEQIAFADIILLNKTDLVNEDELNRLDKRIKSMNSQAKTFRTQNASIDLNNILNVNAFDLDKKTELNPEFLIEEVPFEWCGIFEFEEKEHQLTLNDGPDQSLDLAFMKLQNLSDGEIEMAKKLAIKVFSETAKEIKPEKFINANNVLNRLLINNTNQTFYFKPNKKGFYALFTQHGPEEFNMKCTSYIDRMLNPTLINSDENISSNSTVTRTELTVGEKSKLKLSPLKTLEFPHSHEHDETVCSIGIEDYNKLSIQKVNDWISFLLQVRGSDIYRMKGIMNIADNDERFVFQGVHMLFDGKADRKWRSDEKRKNQIIFIGKNLNREEIMNGYKKCIVK